MITAPTKFSRLLATLFFFVSTSLAQVEGPNGHFYQVVMEPALTWPQAREKAAATTFNGVHGHLATITSSEEDAFIESLRQQAAPPGYGGLWIGGSQQSLAAQTTREGWQWVNGEGAIPMNGQEGYANWQAGEPNDYNGPGSENYLSTGHFNQFGWNDEGYSGQIFGFVVEFPGGGTRATVSVAAIDPVATETSNDVAQPVDEAIFEFTRKGESLLDLPVFYSIHGTALNGIDYNEIPRTITIPAGQSSVRLRITPRPDALAVVENMETVGIRIEPSQILTPSAAYRIDEEHREASAVIFEHSRPTSPALEIALPKSGFVYKSGEVVKVLAVLASAQPVPNVDFYAGANKIGSAAPSRSDQGLSFYQFAWSPNTSGQIELVAKATVAGAVITSSTIQITVEGSGEIPVVSIRFVEGPIPMIIPPADYVTGAFEVSRTGPTTANLQVFYSVTGSATADADYERLPGYAVIPAGRSSARINIAVKQDSIFEPTETVIAYLVPVDHSVDPTSPSLYAIDPNFNNATAQIFDTGSPNPIPVISITASPLEIEEPSAVSDRTISNVRLTRTGSLDNQLTIGLLYSGTATPDLDFGNAVRTITFPVGLPTVAFNIPALEDNLFEGTEHVVISIAEASSANALSRPYSVDPQKGSTKVTILDEDDGPPIVSLWPVQAVTREPGPNEDVAPAVFLLQRNGPTNEPLTVFLSYSGTATPGADYPKPAESIIIARGETQRRVEIYAIDDSLPEGTESIIVTIAPPTTQPIPHYSPDPSHRSLTLSILDNDQTLTTLVRIESPDPIATEQPLGVANSDPARFRISRNNTANVSQDLRVFFSVHGTAQSGVDFQSLPASALIPAGQTFVDLEVVPLPDREPNNPASHHYVLVNSGGVTWEQARALAEQSSYEGVKGHLATITSAEEDAHIDSLRLEAGGGGVFWVGGYQEPGETSITEGWKWVNNEGPIPGVNGSGSGYANWLPSEPNDYWGVSSENHMVIGWLNSFGWNDQLASGVGGYVVEYDLGINPPGVLEPMETVALRLEPSPLARPQPDYLIDPAKRIAAAVIFDHQPPAEGALEIAYPGAGAILNGNEPPIEFVAVAYHPTRNLQNVAFWVANRHIGSAEAPAEPLGGVKTYKLNWTDFVPGTFTVIASGEFPNHDSLRSSEIPFQIRRDLQNLPPVITIVRPADGAVFILGEPVEVRAEASDPEGSPLTLAYWIDEIGGLSTNTNRLHLVLSNLAVGPHSIRVRATDETGASSSDTVNILVRHRDEVSFVERQLPSSYSPGVSFVVQLRANPREGTHAYAVEDQPPQGWVVSGISHEGHFDSATGKVKFGPFTDAASRTLTYQVTPPPNASGRYQFVGRSSANGAAYPITGDEFIELIQQHHPADVNKNFIIVLEEVTAYAAAWKAGESWPTGPNPIPLRYVTSAGRIWRNGEAYRFDPAQGPAPACWVPLTESPAPAFSAKAASSAQRFITGPFLPGAAKSVQISVTPAAGTSCFALEEKPPRGWTVTGVSHNGLFDASSGTIRWGMFFDSTSRSLSYTVTPPTGVTAVGSFSGHLSPDGQLLEVGSATSVIAEASTPIEIIDSVYSSLGVTLHISGPIGQTAVIESTSDFHEWTNISSIFIPNGSVEFTDTSAGDKLRFYRLRVQ